MNNIRIVSGLFRGTSILSPGVSSTHPMGAREKLALFNSISGHLQGAKVLDLYAGSGALGIESISRGAQSATFVEANSKVCQTIKQNIAKLQLQSCTEVVCQKVADFVVRTTDLFDIILIDPPYDNFPTDLSNMAKLLAPDGIVALSHPNNSEIEMPGLECFSTKKYAAARISLYRAE